VTTATALVKSNELSVSLALVFIVCCCVADVLQLCVNCPRLTELDLSDAAAITSQSVEHIVSYLVSLRYLALSRCYYLRLPALM